MHPVAKSTRTIMQGFQRVRMFPHKSRFKIAMTNCNCDIWITECKQEREREKTSLSLLSSIPKRRQETWLVSAFSWHADCYFISIRKCAVYRRKWIEGHIAPPPKSQFRGQSIHTAISLRDLRDVLLENTSGPSFELCYSNYAVCVHTGQNAVICMIIQIAHFALVWKPSKIP